ncbi:uncharacterized protein si:ch1073-126c3.2 [Colossoma macropomum]|uniref:uncharacterized protein si:ch1073-126c3.2 n=1 Tax=Colossoma macropomum TaxID=42526 RepID=UPI001863C6AA|nr:uncharacterized protein si:ch1073-126c3.2 [Colossoma macropomum]
MTATMTRRALKWLCLMLVLVSGGAQTINSTSCPAWSFEHVLENLKVSDECFESLADKWNDSQTAAILDNLRRLTDVLQKQQKKECKEVMPADCPFPVIPSKGGLVCVSVETKVYCKPMCNEGQDFSFLRRSRVYEECSAATKKWTTQYVGGNKLAVCNKSDIQISGAPSAYFPKDQDCLKTKSDQALEKKVIETFQKELRDNNIQGHFTHSCLLCG